MRKLAYMLPSLLALVLGLGALGGFDEIDGVNLGGVHFGGARTADADDTLATAHVLVNKETQRAIEDGTRYLISIQKKSGAWHSNAGKKINERYDVFKGGTDVPHVGVTALAVLSLLAGGHVPGRGPYGDAMDKAIGFLMAQQNTSSGYISAHGTRMYSHAFATLALAEVYGITRKSRVRSHLQLAIGFTVKNQNATGGWRYVPLTNDSDMSVTVCQITALRAARNVGILVPQATIDRALRYILTSAVGTTDRRFPTGAFLYQPFDQKFNRPSFALAAAGLTAMFQSGLYDDDQVRRHIRMKQVSKSDMPTIRRCIEFMKDEYWNIWQRRGPYGPNHYFYWYGNYYAAQAMYQVGGREPEVWRAWYTQVRDHILKLRRTQVVASRRAAYWRSNVDKTHAYATACALLILQFPLDLLPIHQR